MKLSDTGNRLLLIIQSVLCVVLTALLIAAAVGVYREGAARKAEQPSAPIYSREQAAESLAPLLPLFLAGLGLTAACLALGVRDRRAARPAADKESLRDPAVKSAAEKREERKKEPGPPSRARLLRIALLVLALALIAAGVLNGGARDVFNKAIRICTECVGLG